MSRHLLSILSIIVFMVATVFTQDVDTGYGLSLEDFFMVDLTVVTSTMEEEKLDLVPGTITVITDKEIMVKGYNVLNDVLDVIPNFQLVKKNYGTQSTFARGYTWASSHVKVMIDGHPINDIYTRDITSFLHYPLDNVKQIEVIRGPGSALYGTDAFCAVINIITKKEKHTNIALGGGFLNNYTMDSDLSGHFADQFNGNISHHSDPDEDVVYSINVQYLKDKGDKLHYESDWLTGYQNPVTQAYPSLAPVSRYSEKERFGADISLEAFKLVKFRGGISDETLRWVDGFINIMTEEKSYHGSRLWYSELIVQPDLGEMGSLSMKGTFDRNIVRSWGGRLPKGFTWAGPLPIPTAMMGQTFQPSPDGSYFSWSDEGVPGYYVDVNADGTPEYWPEGASADPGSKFVGNSWNGELLYKKSLEIVELTAGVQGAMDIIPSVSIEGNYSSVDFTRLPDSVGEVSGKDPRNFNLGEGTNEWHGAAFVQGIFKPLDILSIVAGLRGDYYEIAGEAFSPRLALVFSAIPDHFLKLSFGRAFSAPNPTIRYSNAFGHNGNKNLKPQSINTLELSFQNASTKQLHYMAVTYASQITNGFASDYNFDEGGLGNTGKYQFAGVELEARYTPVDFINLWANYAYNYTRGFDDKDEIVMTNEITTCRNSGSIGVTGVIEKMFYISLYTRIEGKKPRSDADPHQQDGDPWKNVIDPWSTINSAVVFTGIPRTTLSLTVDNIFDDTQYTPNVTPSRIGQPLQDSPLDGRQVLPKAAYKF